MGVLYKPYFFSQLQNNFIQSHSVRTLVEIRVGMGVTSSSGGNHGLAFELIEEEGILVVLVLLHVLHRAGLVQEE